jgi:hypothetical protein
MALDERFRSGGARGIARFLAEHHKHDAGFDVLRDGRRGTGQMRITCKGCGESVEYRAAEAGELAATPERVVGENRHPPPPPAPLHEATPHEAPLSRPEPPSSPPAEPRRLRPRWFSTAALFMLIGGGLVLIAIGFTRDSNESPSTTATSANPSPPVAQPSPPAPSQPKKPKKPARSQAAAATLSTQSFAGVFSIGVASGWSVDDSGPAVVITSPRSDAEIDVYFGGGTAPLDELADSAKRFLHARHSDGVSGKPTPLQLAGTRALQIPNHYPEGTEVAVVLASGGYTYLLVQRQDRRLPDSVAREASAQLASFRPL